MTKDNVFNILLSYGWTCEENWALSFKNNVKIRLKKLSLEIIDKTYPI